MYGASNTFPAHVMSTFYKVVVVSINYRLGALGFLSTGDENSPGMNKSTVYIEFNFIISQIISLPNNSITVDKY